MEQSRGSTPCCHLCATCVRYVCVAGDGDNCERVSMVTVPETKICECGGQGRKKRTETNEDRKK